MKTIKYFITLAILVMVMFGCQKQTEIYEEYVVVGGHDYPGQVNNLTALSGNNRILIKALRPADPSITELRITWDLGQQSVSVPISNDTPNDLEVSIDNLPESNISFTVRTYDNDGNVSVPKDVFGKSYGENYKKTLSNRSLVSALINNTGDLDLEFTEFSSSSFSPGTEITYTDTSDEQQTIILASDDLKITVPNYKGGLRYTASYKPDESSLDLIAVDEVIYTGDIIYNYNEWAVIDFSTEHNSGDNGVKNFIDGSDQTRWHSRAGRSSYPHFATIDMGGEVSISRFGLARTFYDAPSGDTRGPDVFTIEMSTDGTNWVEYGPFNFNREQNGFQNYSLGASVTARYFRYTATEGPQNNHVMGAIIAYN